MNIIKSYIVTNAAAAGDGSGSVTSFSSGNLSPLFTTSVATATTTPALSFTAVNQNPNLVYAGPATGPAAAPTFRALVAADLPSDSGAYIKTALTSTLTASVVVELTNSFSFRIRNGATSSGQITINGDVANGFTELSSYIASGVSAYMGTSFANERAQMTYENAGNLKRIEVGSAPAGILVTESVGTTGLHYAADYSVNGKALGVRWIPDWGAVLGAKTYTGTQTFLSSGFELNNPANTFQYIFVGAAIVADRNITMPLLTGNDVMVTEAFIQTLTNKTLTSPVINTAISGTVTSGGDITATNFLVGATATQALTNKTINGASNTITNVSLTTGVSGILPPDNGGTGVANNAASTITISGNFATTFTVTATTGVTLPTTGTLATLAGAEVLTNKDLSTGTSWTVAPTITDGLRIVFNPNGTNAGINTGTNAGDPSGRINGDLWYNTSTGSLNTGKLNTTHSIITSPSLTSTANQIPFITGTSNSVTYSPNLTFVINRLIGTTLYLTLSAGTATAGTAPLVMTSGTNLTAAISGAVEYNNTFHMTNSDATRRHVVLAPNTTKVTAGAPYANDGYLVMNVGGTDFKMMTTA